MVLSKPPPDDSARALTRGVLRLSRRLRLQHGEGGLSSLSLMNAMHRLGPSPAAALAREEGLQPQSLTRMLASLEARGLIARRADEADRRRILIELTPVGRRALLEQMGRLWNWLAEAMAAGLDADERAVLDRAGPLLERLAEC
jgi:DNA-binding MarR family transcriptional regulator